MTGLQAYGAVSSALFALRSKQYKAVRSGDQHQEIRGQHIECSLLETQVSALTHLASNYLLTGQEARRRGTSHASIVPYQAFATSDGYMMIAAMNNKQFKDLCCVLDVSHLLDDHRFNENERRVANRDDLLPQLEARLQTQSTSEWMKVLQGTSVGCAPINSVGQALNDEQVLHLNLIQMLEHPVAGPIKTVGLPVSFSQTPGSVRTAPPLLGEHTSELLSEFLQKTSIEIIDLRDRGVVA
ncbi:hypothetical protein SARC_03681 [Sphaeroforma arctica JP610]|uniref:CoA-transferase family III n=1 Tax=Sphaeroforma arctica JP610 TaxID=667725 RepID=A0A0L0G7A9_9EUKA|nr:hypothetical protein SARC_03681 [Sphaeroforma arctica JP610]KNC84088.1 hypothetical protein SARC_03681 [Sphaeroforma arctica JP610]|eukprot:XP_014157990.1 hypothetical protein SARC_03681 [Sphaeroforma arctica JP610]